MEDRKDAYAMRLLDLLRRHTDAGSAQWLNRGFDLGVVFCFVRGETIVATYSPTDPQSPVLLEIRGIQFTWEQGTPGHELIRQLMGKAGDRQVQNAKFVFQNTSGGSGMNNIASVWGRELP